MADEITPFGSVIVPALVSISTIVLGYLWHQRVHTPKIRGLNWLFVQSNEFHPWSQGWICLRIENQKGKAFKWFVDRKDIAENIKGIIKIYHNEELLESQTLTWGLPHGNPSEISLNVGEIERLDVLVKTNQGWCITLGRQTLDEPPVFSVPIPRMFLIIEIVITGKNFAPISERYSLNFPDDLVKYAQIKRPFKQQ